MISGDYLVSDYSVGIFARTGCPSSVAVIAVAEADGAVLLAAPESAWHNRNKSKRCFPPGSFRKAVAVLVPAAHQEDREQQVPESSMKIWLGLAGPEIEDHISYVDNPVDVDFPVNDEGLTMLPLAASLRAVAKDHFTFFSAESAVPEAPPGLASAGEERIAALEKTMAGLQAGLDTPLENLVQKKEESGGHAAKPKRKSALKQPASMAASVPPGVDPAVAQHALAAGVSAEALKEIAGLMNQPQPAGGRRSPPPPPVVDSSDEEEEEGGDPGSGSTDPLSAAVLSLSKIVKQMHQEKKPRKDRGIESILDRAEGGAGFPREQGYSRSKAAAYRALQQLLTKNPTMIYTMIEDHLQQDWELAAAQPGITVNTVTARGWLEHRSRVSRTTHQWCAQVGYYVVFGMPFGRAKWPKLVLAQLSVWQCWTNKVAMQAAGSSRAN